MDHVEQDTAQRVSDVFSMELGSAIVEWNKWRYGPSNSFQLHGFPMLWLADGSRISVQAGPYMYSTPSSNAPHFSHVEVGVWAPLPPTFDEYAYGYADPLDGSLTVYAYVPLELVQMYIASCGGVDVDASVTYWEAH